MTHLRVGARGSDLSLAVRNQLERIPYPTSRLELAICLVMCDRAEQVAKVAAAVVPGIHRLAKQHNLGEAVRSDVARFAHHLRQRTASLGSTRVRHDAVGAAIVAAALHRNRILPP